MLEVTVKTLDGRNRSYCVPDNITVNQFKAKIASSIEIPADKQRLIFKGRVLDDDKELNDYDVNGRTLHVVQRAPPSTTAQTTASSASSSASTSSSTASSTDPNTFVMGSVSLTSEAVSANQVQDIVQQVLSGMGDVGRNARINTRTSTDGSSVDVHINLGEFSVPGPPAEPQARITRALRMLNAARHILDHIDHDDQSEENSSENISAAGSQAEDPVVEDMSTDSNGERDNSENAATSSTDNVPPEINDEMQDSEASPSGVPPTSTSTGGQSQNQTPPTASTLATVLQEVLQLNERIAPHLQNYHQLMQQDQSIESDRNREVTSTQRFCSRISQVLHYVSHVYHSLSDITVDMRQVPPRQLRAPPPPAMMMGSPIIQQAQVQVGSVPLGAAATTGTGHTRAGQAATSTTTSTGRPTPTSQPQPARTGPQPGPQPARGVPINIGAGNLPPQGIFLNMRPPGMPGVSLPQGFPAGMFQPQPAATGSVPTTGTSTSNSQQSTPNVPPPMFTTAPPAFLQGLLNNMGNAPGGMVSGPRIFAVRTGSQPIIAGRMPAPRPPPQSTGSSTTTSGAPPQQTPASSQAGPTGPARGPALVFQGPHGGLPMRGMPGMRPPVDPYMPCQSRFFLNMPARSAAQTTQASTPMPDNTLADVVSNLVSTLVNPENTPASSGQTSTNTTGSSGAASAQPNQQTNEPPFLNTLRNLLQQGTWGTVPQQNPANAASSGANSDSSTSATRIPTASAQQPVSDEVFTQMVRGIGTYISRAALGEQPTETVAAFLNSLGENFNFPQGDGVLQDFFNCVAEHLSFVDLMSLFFGQPGPLNQLRQPLRDFLQNLNSRSDVQSPTQEDIVNEIMRQLQQRELHQLATDSPVKENVDFDATISNLVRHHMTELVSLIMTEPPEETFGQNLYRQLRKMVFEVLVLGSDCLVGGSNALVTCLQNQLRNSISGINPMIQQWVLNMMGEHVQRLFPITSVTPQELQRFVVNKQASPASTSDSYMSADLSPPRNGTLDSTDDNMDVEVDDSKDHIERKIPQVDANIVRHLPPPPSGNNVDSVPVRREDWHGVVPSEWVPIITRDVQQQTLQPPQRPHSDAYLSGMPAKRRRLSRPEKELADGHMMLPRLVQQAADVVGAQPTSSLRQLAVEAGSSDQLHNAYQTELSDFVISSAQSDCDFMPDKYPKTQNLLTKK